jgi:hypothetical protein
LGTRLKGKGRCNRSGLFFFSIGAQQTFVHCARHASRPNDCAAFELCCKQIGPRNNKLEVLAMTMFQSVSREREGGADVAPACTCVNGRHTGRCHSLQCCSVLAVLLGGAAQAEERSPGGDASSSWDRPLGGELVAMVTPPRTPSSSSLSNASPDASSSSSAPSDRQSAGAPTSAFALPALAAAADAFHDAPAPGGVEPEPSRPLYASLHLHADDASSATGIVDSRVQSLAVALDTVLPGSGVTVQPRVELAYRPYAGLPNPELGAISRNGGGTGIALRLYGSQPSRTAGIHPFVEASWWQVSRSQTIDVIGTRIDTEKLRGLFALNVGAHGTTKAGVKLWMKVKLGRNAGATIGARYHW